MHHRHLSELRIEPMTLELGVFTTCCTTVPLTPGSTFSYACNDSSPQTCGRKKVVCELLMMRFHPWCIFTDAFQTWQSQFFISDASYISFVWIWISSRVTTCCVFNNSSNQHWVTKSFIGSLYLFFSHLLTSIIHYQVSFKEKKQPFTHHSAFKVSHNRLFKA